MRRLSSSQPQDEVMSSSSMKRRTVDPLTGSRSNLRVTQGQTRMALYIPQLMFKGNLADWNSSGKKIALIQSRLRRILKSSLHPLPMQPTSLPHFRKFPLIQNHRAKLFTVKDCTRSASYEHPFIAVKLSRPFPGYGRTSRGS